MVLSVAPHDAFAIPQPAWEWSTDPEIWPRQFEEALRARGFSRAPASKKRASPKKRRPSAHEETAANTWQERFALSLPRYPLCGDDFALGVHPCQREIALGFPYIQFNAPERINWLTFDIDRANAANAWESVDVARPNFIMENPENGHAHLAYGLAAPVTYFGKSHTSPLEYLRDIQRGLTRRLGADRAYAGVLTKNPTHSAWRVFRPHDGGYSLGELARSLSREEMRGWSPGERETGLGRNVSVFDGLRAFAYGEVLRFKAAGDLGAYRAHLQAKANGLNQSADFIAPLSPGELRGIVKSVAKWTWKHFTPERFSEIQSWRGSRGNVKRWAGHTSLDESKPWEAEGISRRTWFYRKKSKSLNTAKLKFALSPYQDNTGLRGSGRQVLRSARKKKLKLPSRKETPMRGIETAFSP